MTECVVQDAAHLKSDEEAQQEDDAQDDAEHFDADADSARDLPKGRERTRLYEAIHHDDWQQAAMTEQKIKNEPTVLAAGPLLYPRQDSNLCFCLRRATLYPLSYGGFGFIVTDFDRMDKSRPAGRVTV